MGAAITYLLLDLEGVDTEPDILDDGKKGPWTIFATADCEAQFKAKYGDKIVLTFSEMVRQTQWEEKWLPALCAVWSAYFFCCWRQAPKNALRHYIGTIRHLRTTQDVRRRSV
eukprot:scaffold28924_cov146-Isochrysis_galbana.AAC.1